MQGSFDDAVASLHAAPVIQVDVACGLIPILVGPVALFIRPGHKVHKMMGYVCVSTVAGLALPTIWSLWERLRQVRAGEIQAHRRCLSQSLLVRIDGRRLVQRLARPHDQPGGCPMHRNGDMP